MPIICKLSRETKDFIVFTNTTALKNTVNLWYKSLNKLKNKNQSCLHLQLTGKMCTEIVIPLSELETTSGLEGYSLGPVRKKNKTKQQTFQAHNL